MVADTMVVTMAVDTMVVIHTDTEDTGVKHIMSTKKNIPISQQKMFLKLSLQENFGFDIINCDKM